MKLLKKILSAVGVLAFACSTAFASVPINTTNFPDATFRWYISTNFDTNQDGVLSDAEIAKIQYIDSSGWEAVVPYVNLKGIENFTALKKLSCEFPLTGDQFNYTGFKTTYGLDCDIDDSYLLMMHIEIDGIDGLMTPMINDITDKSTGDVILKLPIYKNQRLESISFRTKGTLNTEVHVYP